MDGAFGLDPKTVDVNRIPARPWWCAECRSPAMVEIWKQYGVCDPCANRMRSTREWQAKEASK